jgi:hypothetical protein
MARPRQSAIKNLNGAFGNLTWRPDIVRIVLNPKASAIERSQASPFAELRFAAVPRRLRDWIARGRIVGTN